MSQDRKELGAQKGVLSLNALFQPEPNPHITSRPKSIVKKLLGEASAPRLLPDFESKTASTPNQCRWSNCLARLQNDFLSRKNEILKLNPGRKSQIETRLQVLSKAEKRAPLEKYLSTGSSTEEKAALKLFAVESSILQLFQFLLFKRWCDTGQIETKSMRDSLARLNWQISTHLRTLMPARLLDKNTWAFLRINIYSWFSPSQETWDFLIDQLNSFDTTAAKQDFFGTIFDQIDSSELKEIFPFSSSSLYSKLSWEVLLRQKCLDENLANQAQLNLGKTPNRKVVIRGSSGGQALPALLSMQSPSALDGVFSFVRSEIELYVAELSLLWALGNSAATSGNFYLSSQPAPQDACFIACFPDNHFPNDEISSAANSLSNLAEHGTLLLASDSFWPTCTSDAAQELRTNCLASSTLRLILDMRHLSVDSGLRLPSNCFLFEKILSKEYRDENRPKIIKVRGHISHVSELEELWQLVLDCIAIQDSPGEVKIFQLGSRTRIRVEVMSAATTQALLGNAPWNSISEPGFYQISSKLKLYPYKLHQEGFLLRPQKSQGSYGVKRGVHFLEIPGKGLFAEADGGEISLAQGPTCKAYPKAMQHLFLPDMRIKESPEFFSAMVNSSAIQFWYRLEWEQNLGSRSSKSKLSSDSVLKLMPLARIFPSHAILPAEKMHGHMLANLDAAESLATNLFKKGFTEIQNSIALQRLVIDLEATVDAHLNIAREYSRHLFPDFKIWRWAIPETVPMLSPDHALQTLQHLQHAPLRQHPSIQLRYMKNVSDFKVTDYKIHEGQADLSELILFSGQEAILRILGPKLLISATARQIEAKKHRPWSELSQKVCFPIDTELMLKQLGEFVSLTQNEIASASKAAMILDFIFCRLFDLNAPSFVDGDIGIIRSHVNPRQVVRLHDAKPRKPSADHFDNIFTSTEATLEDSIALQ